MSVEIYGYMVHQLLQLANGKMICALEGGYNKEQTARAVSLCIQVMQSTVTCPTPEESVLKHKQIIDNVIAIRLPFGNACVTSKWCNFQLALDNKPQQCELTCKQYEIC